MRRDRLLLSPGHVVFAQNNGYRDLLLLAEQLHIISVVHSSLICSLPAAIAMATARFCVNGT